MATNSGVLYIPPRVKQHKGRRHYRNSGGCSAVRSLSNGTQLWCNGVKDHEGKHWAAYRRPTKKVPHPKIIEWTTPKKELENKLMDAVIGKPYSGITYDASLSANAQENVGLFVSPKKVFFETYIVHLDNVKLMCMPASVIRDWIEDSIQIHLLKKLYAPVGSSTIQKITIFEANMTRYVVRIPVVSVSVH